MLKEENAELLITGKRVESDYTFTADSETMKVEVAFTFDATSLDWFKSKQGKSFDAVVAFDGEYNTTFVFPEAKKDKKFSGRKK